MRGRAEQHWPAPALVPRQIAVLRRRVLRYEGSVGSLLGWPRSRLLAGRLALAASGLATLLSAAEPAPRGQPALSDRASALRARADRLFAEGRLQETLAVLAEGLAATGDPLFLFNRGVTFHALGDCEGARDSYQAYLSRAPSGPKSEAAAGALQQLAPICGQPALHGAAAAPSPPPGAVASAASPPAVPLAPAPAGALAGGAPSAPPAPSSAPAGEPRWLGPSLLIAGGAALATASVFGALWYRAGSRNDALVQRAERQRLNWDECCATQSNQLLGERRRHGAAALSLAISSVLLAGSGITLLAWQADPAAPPGTSSSGLRLDWASHF